MGPIFFTDRIQIGFLLLQTFLQSLFHLIELIFLQLLDLVVEIDPELID